MDATSTKFKTVEEYQASVPESMRPLLEDLRKTIKEAAPKAEEVISYNMPAYRQHAVLVYYAACKGHIGFYPTSTPMQVFEKELASYKTSKGAIQFPLDKPIPRSLVKKIVALRIKEDSEKAAIKKLKSKA